MMPDALPPLRETIATYGLGARKALGQHFLLDLNITRKIARLGDIGEADIVIEVGPGPGGLTRALLETGARVIAIEKDRRCQAALAETSAAFDHRLEVIEADALAIDEAALLAERGIDGPVKLASNLPYNISTELLIKWLKASPRWWSGLTLMFQKEVGQRILAAPGSKTFGRLSVIAQAGSTPRQGFDLPARAFTPPPKVESSVLQFDAVTPRPVDLSELEKVTAAAFGQRRKMLRSSLKSVFGPATPYYLHTAGLSPETRAEDVPVTKWLDLSEMV